MYLGVQRLHHGRVFIWGRVYTFVPCRRKSSGNKVGACVGLIHLQIVWWSTVTWFRSMTMFCGTDSVFHWIFSIFKLISGEHYVEYCQSFGTLLWIWGAVYTMDHEVVPRPSKRCDWTLKSSRDDWGLHQGKNHGRVTTEVEVHKFVFLSLLYPLPWSNGFSFRTSKRGGLGKKQGPMPEKCRFNDFLGGFFNDFDDW